GDRRVVDVTHAVLPVVVVGAADRRLHRVLQRPPGVRLLAGQRSQDGRVRLPVVDDAGDVVRPLLPATGALVDRPSAVPDDPDGDQADGDEERDGAPGAALRDLDRGDRFAALAALAAGLARARLGRSTRPTPRCRLASGTLP